MIGLGGMIGAGIFVLTGIAAGVAGPALILAFLLNGIVTSFTAMSYAELGSAFPEAGGGYLWVKEALGGVQGFLAGWMSWFAHAVAGSLYALAFGHFIAELCSELGLYAFGLDNELISKAFMTLIIIFFTYINYRGASETGSIGNIVTITKVVILAIFVLFGVLAIWQGPDWISRFTADFMPYGMKGLLVAMGLTFIAFEGYEIIAQSGEEVINPKRNIPRAIFMAIGIAVVIYILVGIAAIGATTPPAGMSVWEYLGSKKEIAIVEVARMTFPWGIGGIVLLISGIASTMSALNATTYSSSRVSFAMGRDHNLPGFFAKIHPERHTPQWAVASSGILMMTIGWLLPLEDVAATADIMFLMLFMQVNIAVMILRHKRPDLDRGFKIPLFPVIPIIAIITTSFLAIYLFSFSPIAWYFGIAWVVIGLLAYYMYFSAIEAMEKPKEILMEEVLVGRDFSVLVPVATIEEAHILGSIGAMIAQAYQGEIQALHVVKVPRQLTLGVGRLFLKEGRACLEGIIQEAKVRDVPVHTIIRLGRNVADAIRSTVIENLPNLVVLDWPGYTNTTGRFFGSVIDPIVDNPPADVAVVRYRSRRPIRRILVPVDGGRNSRQAVKIAVAIAGVCEDTPASITLLYILPVGAHDRHKVRGRQIIDSVLEGNDYEWIEAKLVEGDNLADTIIEQSKEFDLIVLGATEEPLFKNLVIGPTPERIARRADVTVIMVKRRSTRLHSLVRQTLLGPTKMNPKMKVRESGEAGIVT
jgi:amino acid transporter